MLFHVYKMFCHFLEIWVWVPNTKCTRSQTFLLYFVILDPVFKRLVTPLYFGFSCIFLSMIEPGLPLCPEASDIFIYYDFWDMFHMNELQNACQQIMQIKRSSKTTIRQVTNHSHLQCIKKSNSCKESQGMLDGLQQFQAINSQTILWPYWLQKIFARIWPTFEHHKC